MRHGVDHRKLGRTHAHRKAMLANMVTSLFEKERIVTTDAKAKEARRAADRLITRAKKGYQAYQEHKSLLDSGKQAEAKQMQAVALAHWRQASRVVRKQSALKKLFDELAPQYLERQGGYTRILRLENRLGDNAKTVLLELVKEDEGVEEKPKKAKGKKAKAKVKVSAKKAPKKKAAVDEEEGAKAARGKKKAAEAEAAPAAGPEARAEGAEEQDTPADAGDAAEGNEEEKS
jgi:large subunit ribosomal protein L17